jgi:hypothetical protein
MDVNKIFNLFDSNETMDTNKQVFMDISEYPLFWIGMFTKIILNHINFKSAHLSLFKTAFPDMDINDIKNAGEYIIYTRSYDFLQRLDINRTLDLQILQNNSSPEFLTSLNSSLLYFEKTEEYEKCAFIMQIKSIIQNNLS